MLQTNKQNNKQNVEFDALKLTLASPEQILDWSYGEVTKAETINYRTFRPEPDGLFCEKIFGPTKNFECYCGKYRKVRYRGIICDKCGVEVTKKEVRRERMAHINLVVPVTHVWFAYGVPNKLSIVLNISHKKLLAVIYYTRYMVIDVEDEKRESVVNKIAELLAQDTSKVDQEMEAKIAENEAEYAKVIVSTKKSGKGKDASALEFKLSKLERDHNQDLAKIRHDYNIKKSESEAFYDRLLQVVNKIEVGAILTEDEYVDLEDKDLIFFNAKMGAEAIEAMLNKLDINAQIEQLQRQSNNEKGDKKLALIKRLQLLEGFRKNNLNPTWMILKVIPVLPPELRPIVPLSGGKFATHDLNDLYRRIINRNNRLRRLMEIGAPDVILRNEMRMLQEAVDALIDNQHRPSKPMLNSKKLPYNSLTDQLRGKKGIFRKNLLGKRVDYSGRAVIVGDATLLLHQCGIPKSVALEMFKPFVIQKLLARDLAPNIKVAKDMIDSAEDIIWDILEEVIQNKPVLLNRAPTLHKYSIQAFYPKLVEGEAIRIHPLVCKAFNADFDGDQMAVHLLLTDEALREGVETMISTKNIVGIANGKIMADPSKEMSLGFFLMTDLKTKEKPKLFGNFDDALKAYQHGKITLTEEVISKGKGATWHTSVGRIIFNSVLPEDYPYVNEQMKGSDVSKLIEGIKDKYELEVVVNLLDTLKAMGFKYSTEQAFSFSMADCNVNLDLKSRISELEAKDAALQENYLQGLITSEEKKKLSINTWNAFADGLADEGWGALPKDNPVFQMVESGANGGKIQVRQIITIKGMVRDSENKWVPLPIKSNYRDGLSAFEYFVSASGGRKGVADTALRTPSSGYLTKKLVDVSHDVIIRMEECGYEGEGLKLSRNDVRRLSYPDRLYGRVLAQDLKNKSGKIIIAKGEIITKTIAKTIDTEGIDDVYVRSPLFCKAPLGICQHCYGYDLEQGKLIGKGKAVGVVAAQSIGEPGTQLTLRTFHKGGVEKTDITQGLPRVEELLEARTPKLKAQIAKFAGAVKVEKLEDESTVINVSGEREMERMFIVSSAKSIAVKDGDKVKMGQLLFIDSEEREKQAPFAGQVAVDCGLMTLKGIVKGEETMTILPGLAVYVNDGDTVYAGQQLTEGSIDPKELKEYAGIDIAQKYIMDEVQKVFNEQGVALSDIHFEVIIRQMVRLGRVMESGDTNYLVGSLVNRFMADIKNNMVRREGDKNIAVVMPSLLGIKASALYTESVLSAMSFQEQVRVLTSAAIIGKIDYLRGMKENVMIGKRIPTGDEAMIQNPEELAEVLS